MTRSLTTIPKKPELETEEDFYQLRREGIGFIEQMASQSWTDYNTHDPGITSLEALCYAITDLAYRLGWDIKDILANEGTQANPDQPYGKQAFFTAREILTVNPVSPNDLRRLLIDLEPVRNAWLVCKDCACEPSYYAWCEDDSMRLSYEAGDPDAEQVFPLGLYDVMLELESVPGQGDLNDRKIEHKTSVLGEEGIHSLTMELRFPDIALARAGEWELFLSGDDAFAAQNGESFEIELTGFGATKDYDLFSDASLDESGRNAYLRKHWQHVVYASFQITLGPSNETIVFEHATLRFFGGTGAKAAVTAKQVKAWLLAKQGAGFIQRYRQKALATQAAIASAKAVLRSHRNLDEDYCSVKVAGVEEVAVCADIELRPEADIERVQATIWLKIEQYFNTPIPFQTLQDLLDADEPVEDIFNGPELDSGFIKTDDLEAAELKSWLRVSDIVNLLMDDEDVVAVNYLQLSKYDAEGNVVAGDADPEWIDGKPNYDSTKVSASWLMRIAAQHQPRHYLNMSRFLFYKNGLPLQARLDEATDTLMQLRGEVERPKNPGAEEDLSIPLGAYRNPAEYSPVQYSLPLVYGIGPHGLSSNAPALRRAQARQLKAYLMVYEQLLGNAFAQLAHTADLFSLDPEVERTYFVKAFSEPPPTELYKNDTIVGFDDIADGLSQTAVEAIAETSAEFLDRRNRFLDHLLARFSEQFSDYARLLSRDTASKQEALERLIEDKIAFLSAYPTVSHDRAKAFDYSQPWPHATDSADELNEPGIKKRIGLLLGVPDLRIAWVVTPQGMKFRFAFELIDPNGESRFAGELSRADDGMVGARHELLGQMSEVENYEIAAEGEAYRLRLMDADETLGQSESTFATKASAELMRDELMAWSAHERAIVVEHLLLRPKFPGDALYPACSDGGCKLCGDEDPYSFRLTFAMPGWVAPYADDMEMRRFADRTIQQEIPSHLLAKICWPSNDGLVANECDSIIGGLAELILASSAEATEEQACECAKDIYTAFGIVFESWVEQSGLDVIQDRVIEELLADKQNIADILGDTSCIAVLDAGWDSISAAMVVHFQEMGSRGLQFERFEKAWGLWLEANAGIDWTEERLQARTEAMLRSQEALDASDDEAICECASSLLSQYGAAFYQWMQNNVEHGRAPTFETFSPALAACDALELTSEAIASVEAMLGERYRKYVEVSYRLWIVLQRLAALRNAYPGATLHDCDEGNDEIPVRLDNTALGNYKLRTPDD